MNHARDGTHSLLRDTSQLFLLAQADKSTALKHRFHRYHRAGRHRALTGTEKWQRPGGWFLRFNSALIKVDSRSRSSCSDCASPIGGVWSVHSTICVHPRASGVPIACFVRTAHRLVVWHGAGVTVPNRAAECGANVSQKLEPQMHADQIVQIGNLSLGSVPWRGASDPHKIRKVQNDSLSDPGSAFKQPGPQPAHQRRVSPGDTPRIGGYRTVRAGPVIIASVRTPRQFHSGRLGRRRAAVNAQ